MVFKAILLKDCHIERAWNIELAKIQLGSETKGKLVGNICQYILLNLGLNEEPRNVEQRLSFHKYRKFKSHLIVISIIR